MNAHTPGPWKFGELSESVIDSSGRLVASLDERSGDLNVIEDARLIAAAPEMFAALKDASEWWEHNGCGSGTSAEPIWLELVNAAIAKATQS